MSKIRLDVYLHDNGYFESREKARICIMEGKVFVNNQKEDKPGTLIKDDANVIVKGEKLKYVSRGGYKLEKAINEFNINLQNKICIDIGSSTGGFTDCMLQNEAKKVFAIDCGTNQLDYKLRLNEKVIVMENTNARYIDEKTINNELVDFISVDVSFISLSKIFPVIYKLLKENGDCICLIKPQFEAGRELVEKNGVVKNINTHITVIKNITNYANENNLHIININYSPIKGPAGNIEYLIHIKKNLNEEIITNENIENITKEAHKNLS